MGILFSLFKIKQCYLPMEETTTNSFYLKKHTFFTPSGHKKALVVGINYKMDDSSGNDLNGCVNDVTNIQQYLKKTCFFNHEDITMLCSSDDCTRNKIQCELRELVFFSHKYPYTELWFSFSGHGAGIYSSDEEDQQCEVICPSDYINNGVIYDSWLKEHFVNRLHPTTKLFIVMDCCHSGTNVNLPYQLINNTDTLVSTSNSAILANVVKISGCNDQQTSVEIYDQENQEFKGALTTAFLKMAKEFHGSQFSIIYDNVRKELDNRGFQQKPMLSFSKIGHSNWYLF